MLSLILSIALAVGSVSTARISELYEHAIQICPIDLKAKTPEGNETPLHKFMRLHEYTDDEKILMYHLCSMYLQGKEEELLGV